MSWILTKYFVTAAVVVAVSELAKRSDKLGALIAALPLVTVLALIWLYVEQQPQEKSPTTPGTPSGMYCQPCRCFWCFRCCCRGSGSGRRCWLVW